MHCDIFLALYHSISLTNIAWHSIHIITQRLCIGQKSSGKKSYFLLMAGHNTQKGSKKVWYSTQVNYLWYIKGRLILFCSFELFCSKASRNIFNFYILDLFNNSMKDSKKITTGCRIGKGAWNYKIYKYFSIKYVFCK